MSPYCTPYSWLRRISKADDYDIQTRTLSKFLMEVTLLDHRFLRAKPSLIAAIGMYTARTMLSGEWVRPLSSAPEHPSRELTTSLRWTQTEAFVYYSNYTAAQLETPFRFLLENLADPGFEKKFVYAKFSSKRYLKASTFARAWAVKHVDDEPSSAGTP